VAINENRAAIFAIPGDVGNVTRMIDSVDPPTQRFHHFIQDIIGHVSDFV
jgi:hypothetical protein